MIATPNRPHTPTAPESLALIRSIAGHSQGHEDRALTEIAAVLAGATIDDLVAARTGAVS